MTLLVSSFVTVGFIGNSPYFPGTIASIVASILMWFVIPYMGWQIIFISLIILLGISIPLISKYQNKTNLKDSKEIVIDEFIAMSLILLITEHSILGYILALILFRLFDILKVGPVKWVDSYKGKYQPFGVMADDIVAGLFSLIILGIMGYIHAPI